MCFSFEFEVQGGEPGVSRRKNDFEACPPPSLVLVGLGFRV